MKKKKKKVRLKYKNIVIFLIIITLIVSTFNYFNNLKIKNIFIIGNDMYKDQEIIRLAGIENYPKTLYYSTKKIKNKLNKEIFIKEVKVTKKRLTQVFIELEENYPLYYYIDKTILLDGRVTSSIMDCPTLINEVPKEIKLINYLKLINKDILNKISEIKYEPDEVDSKKFRFTMNDGNYVYVTLNKIEKINKYIDYVKEFNNKKGTLYLNSGEYFKINS